ncbi:hypothetical protein RUM43_001539 [Polyplax serrata]|uniref:Nucleolar complex protein 2 homolog n=1 Tax=Polyplax serrata TaxID=468196 RepID=A0AAN8XPY1_POLSC
MKDSLKKVKKPAQLLKTSKKKMLEPKKKKMASMSVDEFMNGFVGDTSGESESIKKCQKAVSNKKKLDNNLGLKHTPVQKGSNNKSNGIHKNEEEISDNDKDDNEELADMDDMGESDIDSEDEDINTYKSHKKDLSNLKKSDPEFYKYLEENDEDLLNFEDSDASSDEEKVHKPPDELEVASDESDYEPDDEVRQKKGKGNKVTKEMVNQWQRKLQGKCKIQDLREITEAFHAALVSVSPQEDPSCIYKVEGGTIFNSVIRMCVSDLLPAINKILKYKGSKTSPSKCKMWNRVKPILRNYLTDLAEISAATSPNMLRVLLKHIHQLCPFIVCFPIISPKFLKRVIQLWATDEDVIRVLAFLCTLRLANLRTSLLKRALKVMHLTYVRNTKFVSPNTLPGVNFMRQSLCEMFALDNTISYQLVFLYIRQLAIHLRSAITQKKKESYKIVYNWAYVSSLHLWADLFGIIPHDSPLKSLIYPLVQIIIGTIKLIPSSTYYPLRFHCCKILIEMRNKCDVFIPVLPFLLEVLRDFNFSREHKKLTMKPLDFTCLLRCSKSQMKENGFKDALIENVYSLLMEYLAVECHRVSFPDITVPCIIQVKHFVKSCKNSNYSKKMKSIVDKIAENSKFIETERKKLSLKINDLKGVEAAETAIKAKVPPFLKYYESWKKIHIQQQARKYTNNQELGDLKLPVLNKLDKKRNKAKAKSDGPTVLFPSDDEDSEGEGMFHNKEDDDDDDDDDYDDDEEDEIIEDEEEEEEEPPRKRARGTQKIKARSEKNEDDDGEYDCSDSDEDDDIVEDLNYSDFGK